MIRRSILLLSALALIGASCTGDEGGTPSPSDTPTGTVTPSPTGQPEALVLPSSPVLFATMTSVPLLGDDAPPYAGPATPTSLDGVEIADTVQTALADPAVAQTLSEQGFVVVPSDMQLFHFAYQGNVYEGWPVFVTTDAAYHAWHLVFDKTLRSLEQEVLLPELEGLVSALLDAAAAQTEEVAGTPVEDAASRVEQLVQVAAAELGLPVTLGPLAEQEKALIDDRSATEDSPIVGARIDYSLFTPRGHYTRNEDLTRYFVAMSVLGQLGFCLPGTSDCPGVEPARMGLLASRLLAPDGPLHASWRRIYEPTAFLVGVADDYVPPEVAEVLGGVAPAALDDPTVLADDQVVADVVAQLQALRPVQIDPERASIRIMGTRFVIDSFVFDQLIAPNVGTPDDPRNLPMALDLAAAFGSGFAYGVLEEMGETAYENYDTQLQRMHEAIAARPDEAWGSTVYDAWLHALEPSFVEHGEAFPDFMRTQAWAAKAHQSGFGSYAELKHDTILYTKQAVAEGGDEQVQERRNWVEPEPVVFGRLAAVAELTATGLEDRDLLTREQADLLGDLVDLLGFFERIATDELSGRPITEEDNARLTYIGGTLEGIWARSADQTKTGIEGDQDAAIVADIASGGGQVLEVATGRIDRIYVLVPDDEGTFQVAVGGVYSYYEFAVPAGERLTDEAWRAMLDAGEQPERPAWQEVLFP